MARDDDRQRPQQQPQDATEGNVPNQSGGGGDGGGQIKPPPTDGESDKD